MGWSGDEAFNGHCAAIPSAFMSSVYCSAA